MFSVLVDPALRGTPDATVLMRSGVGNVAILSPEPDGSGRWRDRDGNAQQDLVTWLGQHLARGTEQNRVLLLWREIDAALEGALATLAHQIGQFDVRASVVLVGPLPEDSRFDQLHAMSRTVDPHGSIPRGRLITSICYIGSQSTLGTRIEDDDRIAFATDLLFLLLSGGEAAANVFHFFDDPVGDTALWACGLRSWTPRPAECQHAIRLYARSLLHAQVVEALHGDASARDTQLLASRAEATINRAMSLGLADAGAASAGVGPITDWPAPLSNPFDGWRSPFFRKPALAMANERLQAHFRHVLETRRGLLPALDALAAETRKDGQETFGQESAALDEWLLSDTGLARLALLLARYFPGFAKQADRRFEQQKRPCSPAGDPSPADCRARFLDEGVDTANAHGQKLPRLWHLIAMCIGLGGGGWATYRFGQVFGFDRWQVWLPSGLALIAFAAWIGYCLWAGRRLAAALRDLIQRQNAWFHDAYSSKLAWVRDKARWTLLGQLVARQQTVGRRLGQAIEAFFGDWREMLEHPGQVDFSRLQNDLDRLGIGREILAAVHDGIAKIGTALAEIAVGRETEFEAAQAMETRFAEMVRLAIRKIAERPLPDASAGREFLARAADRRDPPILAKLDAGDLSSHFFRSFIIPQAAPFGPSFVRAAEERVPRYAGESYDFEIAPVCSPAILTSRRFLPLDRVGESLRSQEVVR